MPAPLTSLSHGAGCGCKLSAADLRPIVASLPRPSDPRVLVAADTADDAGVVQLSDDLAIVQTADFFTPIVDDPRGSGRRPGRGRRRGCARWPTPRGGRSA